MTRTIGEVATEDLDKLSSFHQQYYGPIRNSSTFRWQYKSLQTENSVLLSINDKDEILGSQGMIPIALKIGKSTVLSGKSESTLLHTKLRGSGMFKQIYEKAIELCIAREYKLIWGFTALTSAFKKVGFSVYENAIKMSVFSVDKKYIYTKLNDGKKINNSILSLIIYSIVSYLLVLYAKTMCKLSIFRTSLRFKKVKNYEIKNTLGRENDISTLYDSLVDALPDLIYIAPSKHYLDWRLTLNPAFKSRSLFVYQEDKLVGYLFLTDKNSLLEISDFTFTDSFGGDLLLKSIYTDILKSKMVYYSGNAHNSLGLKVLKKLKWHGFLLKNRSSQFILRDLSFKDDVIGDIKNWYINEMWSEGL